MRYCRQILVRFPGLRHPDFSGSGLLDELLPGYLGPPSEDRSAPRAAVWRTTLAFLSATLAIPDLATPEKQSLSFAPTDLPPSTAEARFLEALPAPLLLEELRAVVRHGGMDALDELYRRRRDGDPTPISEDTCRKL